MKTIEYKNDKHPDFPGPWDGEIDKKQWEDPATGLACLINRGPTGAWCGYVGVPEGHKFHRVGYMDLGVDLDVHGGLTFSDSCSPDAEEDKHICHKVEPGESDNVWWLGFDCGHSWDVIPAYLKPGSDLRGFVEPTSTYRTQEYVTREVERLAQQISEHSEAA